MRDYPINGSARLPTEFYWPQGSAEALELERKRKQSEASTQTLDVVTAETQILREIGARCRCFQRVAARRCLAVERQVRLGQACCRNSSFQGAPTVDEGGDGRALAGRGRVHLKDSLAGAQRRPCRFSASEAQLHVGDRGPDLIKLMCQLASFCGVEQGGQGLHGLASQHYCSHRAPTAPPFASWNFGRGLELAAIRRNARAPPTPDSRLES